MSLCDEFIASNNPRNAGSCLRCARPKLAHLQPPAPVRRNIALEQETVQEATRGICDPSALIAHAQNRAYHLSGEYVDDPMTIRHGVDRPKEMREELVDLVNHALFHAQEHPEDMELRHDIQIVIRGAAVLYNRLLRDE